MNILRKFKSEKGISRVWLFAFGGMSLLPFIVIFMIIIMLSTFFLRVNKDDEDDPEKIKVESTIIEKNGLQFMFDDSYFCYPVAVTTGTSAQFGASGSHWASVHTGTDFLGVMGEAKIVAVADGKVYLVSNTGAYGNHIILEHQIEGEDGNKTPKFYTMYCHLASVAVKQGDEVKQGQVLGMLGATR